MSEQKQGPAPITRRDFLIVSGTVTIAVGVGCATGRGFPTLTRQQLGEVEHPVCAGYLLVDVKKCQGCMTCMLACSLAHEGVENLSLSRIQVLQDPFARFPVDLTVEQCRQCVEPACVDACPEEALHVDTTAGNVRRVDIERCVGCRSCVDACPHKPGRAIWNFEEQRAQKCDLCARARHFEGGGPGGRQACVEVCPVGAIVFSDRIPVQQGQEGYKVNLRGETWKKMGFSVR